MRQSIANIIQSSPESRQSRDLYRTGRDAWLINATNYGSSDLTISSSNADYLPGYGFLGGTVLLDGTVFCGNNFSNPNCAIYNPSTDTIVNCINADPVNRNYAANSVLLRDGRTLVPPNATTDNSAASIRIYNPQTNIISNITSLTFYSSEYFGGHVLLDGRVFFLPFYSTTALVYNPDSNATATPPMDFPLGASAGGLMLDGKTIVHSYNSSNLYVWDADLNTFQTISSPLAINSNGCCLMQNGNMFFIEAANNGNHYIYNPFTKTVLSAISPFKNYYYNPRTLPDGKILAIGDADLLIYNPFANTYSQIAYTTMPILSSSLLLDGRILLISPYTATLRRKFAFLGSKFARSLPAARVISPFYNK